MRAHLSPEHLDIVPGESATLQIDVYNTAEIIDGFRVEVRGLDPPGTPPVACACTPETLSLFPDTEGTLLVTLDVPASFPAGAYPVQIDVLSSVDATRRSTIEVEVVVMPLALASMTVSPQQATGGRRTSYAVIVENAGNTALDLVVAAADAERALSFAFSPARLSVPVGETATARVWAAGKRPVVGNPGVRLITITASGTGEPPPSTVSFVQKPWIPRAAITLVAVLGALVLWGALLFRGVDRAATQVADQVAPEGVSVFGRVTDGKAGIGGVTVTATGGKAAASTTSLTEGDVGSFRLSGLANPGTYVLKFEKDGFGSRTRMVQLAAGDLEDVAVDDVSLAVRGGTVTGSVKGAGGQALGGVEVSATRGSATVATTTTSTSGSVGFFSVAGLATPATYVFTFSAPGHLPQSKVVELDAGGTATDVAVELAPDTSGVVQGIVTREITRLSPCEPGGCPLAGAEVELTDGKTTMAVTTASEPAASAGRFQLAELPAGTYTLRVRKEGYEERATEVSVAPGRIVDVAVAMQGAPGVVKGSATDCTRVEVRLRDLTPLRPARSAQPAEDGNFVIGDVPTPGEYRVVFTGPRPQVLEVTLEGGEQREVSASCRSETASAGGPSPGSTSTTTTTTAPPSTTTTTAPSQPPLVGSGVGRR